MTAATKPVSILLEEPSKAHHSPTFGEVIAYLHGVADTVTASSVHHRPLSLVPVSVAPLTLAPSGSSSTTYPRMTVRFGELPFERESAWPQVAMAPSTPPTRGGSRLLDAEWTCLSSKPPASWQYRTLPYGAPCVSLAAGSLSGYSSIPASWSNGERRSDVRLRTAELPQEWYELTGTNLTAVC
jgi:hypothetical protein